MAGSNTHWAILSEKDEVWMKGYQPGEAIWNTQRHTFSKNLIDAGISLEKVASLLGHSSLNTTRIYTTPGEIDLENAVARLAS